jgi:hypothetical protein
MHPFRTSPPKRIRRLLSASLLLAAPLGLLLISGMCQATNVYRVVIPGIRPIATSTTPSTTGLILQGGAGMYADGTYAASCNAYLQSSGNYTYSGYTGDGLYWIKPVGASAAFQATCDMTQDGGGWTLIGKFNGSTDTSLTATQRNLVANTQAKISLNGSSTSKLITCYASPTTGFAADNTAGINCTTKNPSDSQLYSIRVNQASSYTSTYGNYGFYYGNLAATGGCNWNTGTYVWGRHYNTLSQSTCQNYGNGENLNSANGWGTSYDWLLVR